MKCSDLQFILPLYSDDALSEAELSQVSRHLDRCPVCRQKLVDFQVLRNGLRAAGRPEIPVAALRNLKTTVAQRLASVTETSLFHSVRDRRRWIDVWLMPYAVGSLTTLILGFTLLWVMVMSEIDPRVSTGGNASGTSVLVPYVAPGEDADGSEMSAFEYASSRSNYSGESPSVNPKGSLVQAAKTLLRNEGRDNEVTVVADVYGNGAAEIAEVIEPSSDRNAISELQKALESISASPAFVPASFDNRSDRIRVVLKIQNVVVNTHIR